MEDDMDNWREKITLWMSGELVNLLYRAGVHRSFTAFSWLIHFWPMAALAIYQCECGRHNTFLLCCLDRELGEDEESDYLGDVMTEMKETIERSSSPMGYDEYGVIAQRLGPIPGEKGGVRSGDISFLKKTLDKRPVLDTKIIQGDRYYDWYRGDGRAQLLEIIHWADPTPDAPVSVLRLLCSGQGLASIAKGMDLV
jgi:hypothetical protein